MKSTIIKLSLFIAIACLAACADDALDPFRLKEQTKGSILALRGDSFASLNDNGCSNTFFKNKIVGDEAFVMDVEYLSEDPTSLQEIQVFAHYQRPDPDNAGQFLIDKRAKVKTFAGSTLTSTGGANPTGVLSIPLADVLPVIGDPDDLADGDLINIESDLLLTNGTVVFSTSVVNVGLYQSGIFYPAQTLVYCFDDINNYYPVPKFGLRVGTPLKNGSKDTLNITYGSEIGTPPTVALVGSVGTLGALVADPDDDSGTKFYAIYTAGPGYTGPVSVTVKGAVNGGSGATAGLVQQNPKTATIQVDNLGPELIGEPVVENQANPAAGSNIGRDQYLGITLNFQEELDPGTDLLISVTGQNLDPVDEDVMTISENGKSATYTYIYKDTDDGTIVTPGDLSFEVTGGADLAGNAFAGKTFTTLNDIGEPPVPVVALDAVYDIGNYIKWSATTSVGPNNPGGATSGTIFYAAVPSGADAPEQAVRTVKGVVVNDGFDFGTEVPVETGSFDVTNGAGEASNKFITNGDFDVYFYFVNATGNVSKNTGATAIHME